MRGFLDITSALADETRVRVLMALKGRELCLCQIIELLGLSQSTVSRHMSILKRAGLVESRKEGKWSWFKLAGGDAPPAVCQALEWVEASVAGSARVEEDARRLSKILEVELDEVCRRNYRS